MGIYIKGMEMPECCDECVFMETQDSGFGNDYICSISKEDVDGICDCPLIEVPEDVQLVKHGRWEEVHEMYGVEYSCSVCGCYALWKELTTDQVCTEYCPHCGAKMDDNGSS